MVIISIQSNQNTLDSVLCLLLVILLVLLVVTQNLPKYFSINVCLMVKKNSSIFPYILSTTETTLFKLLL